MIVRHAWTDEPHNSPSVRKIDGVETARNVVLNPSRQIDEATLAQFSLDASSLHDNVGKQAMAIFSFKSSGGSRPDAYIRDTTAAKILHSFGYFAQTPDYTKYVFSFVIPEEVTNTDRLSLTVRDFSGSNRSAKNAAVIIPTDETVLISSYFDGDTPDYQHPTARLFQFGEWITLP